MEYRTPDDTNLSKAIKITIRDASGASRVIPLDATIDETIEVNIISAQLFNRLQPHLGLETKPTGLKIFTDSNGAHYTASNTVTLLIGQQGKDWSAEAIFYISESQDAVPGGGNRILLGDSLKARFSLPGEREGRENQEKLDKERKREKGKERLWG
jgi:hypothetical protein